MEPWLSRLLLILVALIFVGGMIPVWRYIWQQRRNSQPDQDDRGGIIEMNTHDEKGIVIAESEQRPQQSRAPRKPWWQRVRLPPLPRISMRRVLRLVPRILVLLLVVAGAGWFFFDWQARRAANQFVVLVVPFQNSGSGQTGAAVADDLAEVLADEGEGRLVVRQSRRAPANEQEALELVRERNADVLIWGNVEPGGMLNDATLTPLLTYAPHGTYAPHAWTGYSGRFAMEGTYPLTDSPINGQVVLPDLLRALANYSQGDTVRAADEFERLVNTYELNSPLLAALEGNIAWARGSYAEGADAYRRAQAVSEANQAQLMNNLGAILLDSGDDTAQTMLTEAAQQPGAEALAALAFNQGLLHRQQNNLDAAVQAFEQARAGYPADDTAPTVLHITLADTYRALGRLDAAQTALDAASDQIARDVRQAPESFQDISNEYLSAMLYEQRGLLQLAQQIDARGPLAWELEVVPPQNLSALQPVEADTRTAAEIGGELAGNWRRLAVASAAAAPGMSDAGRLGEYQALQAERTQSRRQYHLALALIEIGRAPQVERRGMIDMIWDGLTGGTAPLNEAREILAAEMERQPENVELLMADARALLVQSTRAPAAEDRSARIGEADERYNQVMQIAPARPEGYYGKALIALTNSDGVGARQFLQQSLERNRFFFPARATLAQLAEQDGDWETALFHRQVMADQYPVPKTQLALATTLRQSGDVAQAEQVLLRLTGDQNVEAEAQVNARVELAQLYRSTNRLDQAIDALEQARTMDTHSDQVELELGRVLMQRGASEQQTGSSEDGQDYFQRAERHFRNALDASDNTVQAQAHLALADLYAGPLAQPDAALEHYRNVLEIDELQDPEMLVHVGNRLLEFDDPEAAVTAFERADGLQPDGRRGSDPVLERSLAEAYLRLDRLADAEVHAQNVLNLTEDSELRAAALVTLGDVARQQGDYAGALDLYNQALVLDPARVEAALGLGQVAAAQENWAVALGHFERTINFPDGAENALAQFWYAEALLRQNNPREALAYYERALNLRSQFPEALLGTAQAHYALGDMSAAMQMTEEARRQRDEYAEALLFQGKLHEEQGSIDAAMDAYGSAIQANEQLPEPYYRRGVLLIEQRNYDEAIRNLRDAAGRQPDNADAHYWLAQAYIAVDELRAAQNSLQRVTEIPEANGELVARARADLERIEQEQLARESGT